MITEQLRERLSDWELNSVDEYNLCEGIGYLQNLLGMELRWNPGPTGCYLIEKYGAYNRPWAKRPKTESLLRNEIFYARDLGWLRQPTRAERERRYLIAYDKNNMYLASFAIPLGIGDYYTSSIFYPRTVGFWECELTGGSEWNGEWLPSPAEDYGFQRRWLPTQTVKLCEALGYSVTVKAGIYWPDSAPIARPLYDRVRRALEALGNEEKYPNRQAAKVGTKAAKILYTRTSGYFAFRDPKNPESINRWSFRPDWRALIMGEAKARLFYNLQKQFLPRGYYPVAISTDEIYFCADELPPVDKTYKLSKQFVLSEVLHTFDGGTIGEFKKGLKKWRVENGK